MKIQTEMEKKIIDAFFIVLKTTSFSKTKVTTISDAAGISHQTFYRYYVDKYDLAYKITTQKFFAFYDLYHDSATWKEIVTSILLSIKNCPLFFRRLLEDPDGSDIVLKSIIAVTENFTGNNLSRHSVAAWISIFKDWSKNNFKDSVDTIYEWIKFYTPVKEVFDLAEVEKIMAEYENRSLDYFKKK